MTVNLIPIIALLIPIIVTPTALGLAYARKVRELEHAERLKALELGRLLPEDEWSPGSIAMAIGAGVPLGSLGIAWLAGQSSPHLAEPLAIAAGMIGLGGVICGTILASRRPSAVEQPAPRESKPAYDPDAFDVVGSRG